MATAVKDDETQFHARLRMRDAHGARQTIPHCMWRLSRNSNGRQFRTRNLHTPFHCVAISFGFSDILTCSTNVLPLSVSYPDLNRITTYLPDFSIFSIKDGQRFLVDGNSRKTRREKDMPNKKAHGFRGRRPGQFAFSAKNYLARTGYRHKECQHAPI